MSVTFHVSMEEVCDFDGEPRICYAIQYPPGYDNTPLVDPDWPEYGACVYPPNPWELNVSNDNAYYLMEAVGITVNEDNGLCGVIADLADLIARCDAVIDTLAIIPQFDAGTESTTIRYGDNGPAMVYCGRSEGYLHGRVSALRDIAIAAQSIGGVVSYS